MPAPDRTRARLAATPDDEDLQAQAHRPRGKPGRPPKNQGTKDKQTSVNDEAVREMAHDTPSTPSRGLAGSPSPRSRAFGRSRRSGAQRSGRGGRGVESPQIAAAGPWARHAHNFSSPVQPGIGTDRNPRR